MLMRFYTKFGGKDLSLDKMVLDSKAQLLSMAYEVSCPLTITSRMDDNDDFHQYRQQIQKQRLESLVAILEKAVMKGIMNVLAKVVEVDNVLMPSTAITTLLKEIVELGESEPYGVRGGTLVVMFVDRLGKTHKIGKFALDPTTISTYELHIQLFEDKHVKVKLAALIRRLAGRSQQLMVDSHFQLKKKKLYRSSTSSEDSLW